MNKTSFFLSCAAFSGLAMGLLIAAPGPAAAQQDDEVLEEIVVEAPRAVRHTVEKTSSGGTIELIQLRRRVSYADLDLTNHGDVTTLEERVNATAEEACDKLAEMYPMVAPNNPNCVDQAVSGAMEQVEQVVAAAN